jgi:hypothetical protein
VEGKCFLALRMVCFLFVVQWEEEVFLEPEGKGCLRGEVSFLLCCSIGRFPFFIVSGEGSRLFFFEGGFTFMSFQVRPLIFYCFRGRFTFYALEKLSPYIV